MDLDNLDKITKLHVQKRDGSLVPFNEEKIYTAIHKAIQTVDKSIADGYMLRDLLDEIVKKLQMSKYNPIGIEYIQDTIVNHLISSEYQKVGIAYSDYRLERDRVREKNTKLFKDICSIVEQTGDDILNENANKDGRVIPTQRDLLAGTVAKHYARTHLLPEEIVKAHDEGYIHFHDMDYSPFFPMSNCCLVDLKFMLQNGFKMGNAEIESPKSIATAAQVTAQIIAQVSSHQYGGTSINRIDEVLEPYAELSFRKHWNTAKSHNIPDVEKYALEQTNKEVYDACQSLEYEVNTLHTSNGQTPFVTFGFGLGESRFSKMIQESILKVRIKGLGKKGLTPVFPKLVFALKDGLNTDKSDQNYDIKQLALECASKRMYPDILSYEKLVEVTGSFKSPMGCRSFLSPWTDPETGKVKHDGRNNLGVVSINLVRCALESNDEIEFWKNLDKSLEISKKALFARLDTFKGVKASVAPILYMEGAFGVKMKADDLILDLFKDGRSSISLGYIGIHETIIQLTQSKIINNKLGKHISVAIVKKLHDACEEWTKETGFGFSLYATPSENLCNRFCEIDKKKFGEIFRITDKGYYTNSFHLDVNEQVNPYDKIDFESVYPEYSYGGFITYTEFPNMQKNLEGLENVWDYARKQVPYFGTNTPIDECFECGFTGEFTCTSKGFECPKCGNRDEHTVSVTRRVCGYLGAPNSRAFNKGKQNEVQKRVKHI